MKKMLKKIAVVVCMAMAAVVVVSAVMPSVACAKETAKALKVEGRLVSVNTATDTVTIQSGAQVVAVIANAQTKIERNGRRVTLAAFKAGDRVQAVLAATGGSVATKIEAVGP